MAAREAAATLVGGGLDGALRKIGPESKRRVSPELARRKALGDKAQGSPASSAAWSTSSSSSVEGKRAESDDGAYSTFGSEASYRAPTEAEVVGLVARSLSSLAAPYNGETGKFVGSAIPKISLADYFERMTRYLNEWQPNKVDGMSIGLRALAMSMVYIDRIVSANRDFKLTEGNLHRLCMTAMLVSTKLVEDIPCPNSFWSRVGGVALCELNHLERDFVKMLRWRLNVSSSEFNGALAMLLGASA